MDLPIKLNGLDLFSGVGGITLALDPWVRPVLYCEADRYATALLLSRIVDLDLPAAPIWDDVRTLTAADVPEPIDIIYGGFPCQDLSVAGNGRGLDGERSGLFFEVERLISELRPSYVFLENVPAIRTRGADVVAARLAALGYDARWDCLSAYDVGAPHLRDRWFLLARRAPTDAHGRPIRNGRERDPEGDAEAGRLASDDGLEGPLADSDGIRLQEREGIAGDGREERETATGSHSPRAEGEGRDAAAMADAEPSGRGPRRRQERRVEGEYRLPQGDREEDPVRPRGRGPDVADAGNGEQPKIDEGDDALDGERSTVGRRELKPARSRASGRDRRGEDPEGTRTDPRSSEDPGRDPEAVADAEGERLPSGAREPRGGPEAEEPKRPSNGLADLADSDRRGLEGERVEERRGLEGSQGGKPNGRGPVRELVDAEVPDAESVGRGEGIAEPEPKGEAEPSEPGCFDVRWWAAEPNVGRTINGLSNWLDDNRWVVQEMGKKIIDYAEKNDADPNEILCTLRRGAYEEALREASGGPLGISPATILLASLLGVEGGSANEAWLQLESQALSKEPLRGLRYIEEPSCSSYRPGPGEQPTGEYSDALQELSRLLACYSEAAWAAYSRQNADADLGSWGSNWESGIARVANDVPNRVDRLKGLGNAVVPLQAREAFRRLAGFVG